MADGREGRREGVRGPEMQQEGKVSFRRAVISSGQK